MVAFVLLSLILYFWNGLNFGVSMFVAKFLQTIGEDNVEQTL